MSPFNEPMEDGAGRRRGRLITLEGGEGSGKSTQIGHLLRRLRGAGVDAIATREPGGSEGAEILRKVLLSGVVKPLGPTAEAILFAAARIDHIDETIEPALAAGTWVVSDRFADSTRAYQGGAGAIDPRLINALERVTLGDLRADLTLILDLPPEVGLLSAARRRGSEGERGPLRKRGPSVSRDSARGVPGDCGGRPIRCEIIDAGRSEAEVAEAVWSAVSGRLMGSPISDLAHGV